jgi:hypothetical protein
MAKWHRREQKRWKKRRELQRASRQPTHMITVTKDGRTAVGPKADHAVTARYIAAHSCVPRGIEAWSDEQIREVAASLDRDKLGSWERVLVLLAHHQSRLSCDLIKALWAEAPEELHGFCEQAYAEALMWIGESYQDESAGEVLFEVEAEAEGGRSN